MKEHYMCYFSHCMGDLSIAGYSLFFVKIVIFSRDKFIQFVSIFSLVEWALPQNITG